MGYRRRRGGVGFDPPRPTMPRYRKIPTAIRSERDLERALLDMGLKNVEVHSAPVPLDDWIGRPTEVRANVIVRRKDLGASADDMGFARNAQGTLDLIVSEIHLFRFDRKWLENLAQRTGTELPATGTIQFAAGTVGAPATRAPLLTPLAPPPPPTTKTTTPSTPASDSARSGGGTRPIAGSRPNESPKSSAGQAPGSGGNVGGNASKSPGASTSTTPSGANRSTSPTRDPAAARTDTHSKPTSGGGSTTERGVDRGAERTTERTAERATAPTTATPASSSTIELTPSQRARSESALLLSDLAKTQKLGRLGCVLYFVPAAIWLFVTAATLSEPSIGLLIGIMVPWTFVFMVATGIILAARFASRVSQFKARFPAGSELRDEAVAHLKTVARDSSNAASQTATRVLHVLETKATSAIKPPKPPREPGSTGR